MSQMKIYVRGGDSNDTQVLIKTILQLLRDVINYSTYLENSDTLVVEKVVPGYYVVALGFANRPEVARLDSNNKWWYFGVSDVNSPPTKIIRKINLE